jgi:ribosomal-protein-alanine N-acetyltransferase
MATKATAGECVPWALVERSSGIMFGTCGINAIDPETMTGELGYALSEPFWGKGYATEAARAVRDFSFSTLKLELLNAVCNLENLPSAHVLEKIGMTFVGTVERLSVKEQAVHTLRSFSLDRAGWNALVVKT